MYLKALEIQGFKSFPDKTRLTFDKDVTAIVGPNGSGKSNISDAVLWVMGEQRTKALRGSKMEDVIFGGTEKRGAMGYAQVSLILDNSAHFFDSELSEIMLTRRYYRSGESEYFINRENVRLKDISGLLMDTGLGRDGYSIIGQGKIAEIVSSKSTDRREIFEEAAGISRYRYRKEEAQRKLERTEENLLRINDKIEELELQVGPLKEQAEVAKRYLMLRDQLRVKEISAWMCSLDKLRAQADSVNAEYNQTADSLESAKAELEALYASTGSISERMHQKDVETEQMRERLSATEGEAAQCESRAAVLRANIKNNTDSMERMLSDIAEQEQRVSELQVNIDSGKQRALQIKDGLKDLQEQTYSNANVLDGCRIKLQSRERRVTELTDKLTQLKIDCRSTESRVNLLSDMERSYEGFSKAVKTVMLQTERGNLKGIHGPVASLLKVDDECALAIETALGAAGQNIVTDNQNTGRSAIELLKRMDAGRATFLPIDTIRGTVAKDAPERDPGYVGLAYELVRFEDKYQQIFANLLGRTVVAETLADAVRISKACDNRLRIVSLDGQLINAGGSMTGGSAARGSGILSRANELEKLKTELTKLREKEETCTTELGRAKTDLAAVKYQMDIAAEEQAELRSKTSSFQAELSATENSLGQLQVLMDSLSGDSQTRREAVEASQRQIDGFSQRLREKEAELEAINLRAKAARDQISEISRRKLELEGKRTKAEKEAQSKNNDILELERRKARIEQKKISSDMEEKQILDKLWDNYELSHSAAQSLRQEVESLPKANKEINELRRQINALGTPNIGAINEYERVSTRYNFLSEQRSDVDKAKKELADIISDITRQMEELFSRRFKEIDESFRQTFLELFGGGRASLELDDESRVLDCGIEIKVQPPGKALSTISLLSGGEMAFVAIALYFAIMKVSPTPFCIMDEIEAALDEANVTRFAEYIRRVSQKTQFLIITHRRGTMEEADMLYGVTMQEKGVSTVIELDLESARKVIKE